MLGYCEFTRSDEDVSGPIPRGMWHSVAGGESGWAIPDPMDNNIVWATGTGYGSVGGTVERFDERTRHGSFLPSRAMA